MIGPDMSRTLPVTRVQPEVNKVIHPLHKSLHNVTTTRFEKSPLDASKQNAPASVVRLTVIEMVCTCLYIQLTNL